MSGVQALRPSDQLQIGSYQLLGRLGEGGMGTVYLAQAPDGTQVAIKVIRDHLLDREEFRDRFRGEVERAKTVPPFCTAEVIEADPDHDPPYLVAEYVDGPTLADIVKDSGPLTGAALQSLGIGVATALTAIHGAGVIHRDLKPGNVLLPRGGVKVIDFGLARDSDTATGITRTDQVMGTVPYISPERLGGGLKALTPASDVFAWGAVLCYAATGHTPFGGDTPATTAIRILTGEPDLTGVSGGLREVVARTLAKNPDDRPTARELLDLLMTIGSTRKLSPDVIAPAHAAIELTTADDGTTTNVPLPRRPRRRKLLVAVVAGVVAAAMAGALAASGSFLPSAGGTGPTGTPTQTGGVEPAELPLVIPSSFEQMFSEPLTHVGSWSSKSEPKLKAGCQVGKDGLAAHVTGLVFRCAGPTTLVTDVAILVNVTLTREGSCAGIWFRYQDPPPNGKPGGGYALMICSHKVSLIRHERNTEGKWVQPQVVGTDFAEPLRLGEPSRFAILAVGGEISFYHDDVQMWQGLESTYTQGRFALGVVQELSTPGTYAATFSNIEVWTPAALTQPSLATTR